MSELYEALSAKFEHTYKLPKGNTELDYLTLEQIVSRLNDVLGVDGWDVHILGHGQDEHHCWVHAQLVVYFAARTITREQFGECSITRGMVQGDARKGACSDAIKKCASLIGVGLYLSVKEEHADAEQRKLAPPAAPTTSQSPVTTLGPGCEQCGASIKSSTRKDGTTWTAKEKAEYSRNKYGRVLCYPCGQGLAS